MIKSPSPVPFISELTSSATLWPSIQETYSGEKEDDWEFVDTSSPTADNFRLKDATSAANLPNTAAMAFGRHIYRQLSSCSTSSNHKKGIPKVMSTPDLHVVSHYKLEDSDEDGGHDIETVGDVSTDDPFVKVRLPNAIITKKPSFKDAILLNLQETVKEQLAMEVDSASRPLQEKRRVKPKFVVKKITRCSHSTGDLTSLSTIRDGVEEVYSSGCSVLPTVHDIVGATDAEDFYERKRHGEESRRNGLKLRPDEAKRKEFAMCKRAMQRQSQNC
jgi:hypothetical protein